MSHLLTGTRLSATAAGQVDAGDTTQGVGHNGAMRTFVALAVMLLQISTLPGCRWLAAYDQGRGDSDTVVQQMDACVPRSCELVQAQCGRLADGCGGRLDCGRCIAPDSCGGGGRPNRCGYGFG